MFRNIWTIAQRDFRSYFTSPIAYVVIGAFMSIVGFMFFFNLDHYVRQMAFSAMGNKGVSVTDGIVRPFYGNMNVILLFIAPMITMRLFSEEKKMHTIELLMTSPLTLTEIIVGKFCSAMLLVGVMLLVTSIYPIVLFSAFTPDYGPIVCSYVGTFLLAGCYMAVGLFLSSMTENQVVAAASTFGVGLMFWIISWAASAAGPFWSGLLTNLSLIGRFNNFGQGLLNSADIFFYLSYIFVGLFLTHRVMDSYRWR
ncbi:ABC transporter permease [bacterium]|jgi:ABC-2 type transport system permease protein|nr:ABC transporter permease [bacterium]